MGLALPATPEELRDAALGYAARGWHVIPLHTVTDGACSCGKSSCGSAGKHPRTANGLKNATTDAGAIRRWWAEWPTANVGVVTGSASGVLMVGPDGPVGLNDLAELEKKNGPLPSGPVARSGSGGQHLLFRHPGRPVKNRKNHLKTKIDVRGDGGYFVASPSVNGSGPYEWINGPDAELPPPPEWLAVWCETDETKPAPPPAPSDFGNVPAIATSRDSVADAVRVLDRARAYLKRVPAAVSGQGGHNQTFSVACALWNGFELGADATYQLLATEYNPRCVPPWSEKELRHKVSEAAKASHQKPRGHIKNASLPGGVERGESAYPFPKLAEGSTVALPDEVEPRFRFIENAVFAAGDYRANFLVKRILVKGEPGVIAGPSKGMKTSTGIDLAVSLATGTPFLGSFDVPHAVNVAVISGESGPGTLQETARRICEAKGFDLSTIPEGKLHWCFDVPILTDLAVMAELTDEFVKRSVTVAMLDPMYLMMGDVDEKSLFSMGKSLRVISTMLVKSGITPIIFHHANRKMESGQPMELTDLAYAGLEQFLRQYVFVSRREKYESDGVHKLWLRAGGSAGHGGLWAYDIEEGMTDDELRGRRWNVTVSTKDERRAVEVGEKERAKSDKEKLRHLAERNDVFDAIVARESEGKPVTKNYLKGEGKPFSVPKNRIDAIVESLVIDGKVKAVNGMTVRHNGAQVPATLYSSQPT